MEFPGYHYYKLNRIFLLSLGLWPYGKSFFKQIQTIFCIILLASSVVTQLLKLFTMEYDLGLVLTNLSYAFPSIIYLLKYNTFYIQSHRIRELMEQIRNNWNALKDEQEIKIIKKYTIIARRYMYAFIGFMYPGAIIFMLMPLLPDILDIVAPLNESRSRYLPFMAEYFLNQQKYFYPILLHMNTGLVIGLTTFVTTESIFFAYIYHICGMFKIASYRIDHVLDEDMLILSTMNRENALRMKIADAVEIHQRAIEFFEYLVSTFSLCYSIFGILGIFSLSINLFRLFQIAGLPDQKKDFLLFVIFVFCHVYYMFISNYIAQKLIDHSIRICEKTYDIRWYTVPVRTQKLLLFVMQKSTKSCKFVLGGIYPVSLEGFTTFASMSLSYFTVIYSLQQ